MGRIFERKQLAKNIFSSWLGYGLRIVIALFFIPYITSILGDDRYGVWIIVFQTVNYFSLLDLGLEKALIRYLSRCLGRNDFPGINRVINTTWLLYIIVGTSIIAATYITATYLFGYFKISDPILLAEGRSTLMVIGVYVGTRFYLLPFSSALGGFQRHDINTFLQMIEEVVRITILVWLLANGHGLVALAAAILITGIARQLVALVWLRRLYPQVVANLKIADRGTAKTLLDYSKISFGITLAWLVIFNTDSVLLGLVGSAAAAGVYAPGAQMMLYFRNIINSIGSPLTTAVSHWETNGDINTVRRLYLKGVKYSSFLSFFIAVGVIIWAESFVSLWLPAEFAGAASVMVILSISTAVFIPQILGNAVLFGMGQHRYLLYVLLCEASAKIILSLLLIGPYGIVGMALAAAIPQLLFYTTLYPRLIGKVLGIPSWHILRTSLVSGFIAVGISAPVAVLLKSWLPPVTWLTFFGGTAIVTVITVSAAVPLLDPIDRARIGRRLRIGSHRKP